jgi:hypothetical protein
MKLDSITVDIVYKEEPKYTVVVTKHPVEKGAQITDHAHSELDVLSIECLVSDLTDNGVPSTAPYAAAQLLKDLKDNPRPIRIEGAFDVYDPVMLTTWSPIRDSRHGAALRFRAEFVQWKVATTRIARVKRTAPQVKKGAADVEYIQPKADQSKLSDLISGKAVGPESSQQVAAAAAQASILPGGSFPTATGSGSVHQRVP